MDLERAGGLSFSQGKLNNFEYIALITFNKGHMIECFINTYFLRISYLFTAIC